MIILNFIINLSKKIYDIILTIINKFIKKKIELAGPLIVSCFVTGAAMDCTLTSTVEKEFPCPPPPPPVR